MTTPTTNYDPLQNGNVLNELQEDFSRNHMGSSVSFSRDRYGQIKIDLETATGTKAGILSHGANLIELKNSQGKDIVWLSDKSQIVDGEFSKSAAPRGGKPICIPQIGGDAPGGTHGFVRINEFEITETFCDQEKAVVTMALHSDSLNNRETLTDGWDQHNFKIEVTFTLSDNNLTTNIIFINYNESSKANSEILIAPTLHDYFAVNSITARVNGLKGIESQSKLEPSELAEQAERAESLIECKAVEDKVGMLESGWGLNHEKNNICEIEQVFPNAFNREQNQVYIEDNESGLRIEILTDGYPDGILWSPGEAKSGNMGDTSKNDWTNIFCFESSNTEKVAIPANGGSKTFEQSINFYDLNEILPLNIEYDTDNWSTDLIQPS